jgi:3-dehydroquinate dehydratase-1
MRLKSKKKIIIRGKEIGGEHPLVCLPLVAVDKDSLIEQAKYLVSLKPDLIEWRIDSFNNVEKLKVVIDALQELREVMSNIPLLFTLRCAWEGGAKKISQSIRKEIIIGSLKTGLIDIVDFELSNDAELIKEIKAEVKQNKATLILSCHNFENTPDKQSILNKLEEAYNMGADIAKLCVMPQNYSDVLTLLSATLEAREEILDIPLITIAMGEMGAITRIAGGMFGSDVTFAIGKEVSGPGQIPLDELKAAWKTLDL